MRVSELMSTDVKVCSPDDSIMDAARTMRDIDAGVLPVGENDRLVGMLTDRDIVVRAIAEGRGPESSVREAMSPDIHFCFEDEELDDVAEQMGELKVRRLPVLNRDKRLVGIISLGDIALASDAHSGEALSEISEPGGQFGRN